MLKRLEATGHVTRRRDKKDERQVPVSVTEKGRSVFKEVFCGCDAIVEATGLDSESYARLQGELVDLRNRLLAAAKA